MQGTQNSQKNFENAEQNWSTHTSQFQKRLQVCKHSGPCAIGTDPWDPGRGAELTPYITVD